MPEHNTTEELKALDQRLDKYVDMQLAFAEMCNKSIIESARVATALERLEEHSKCRDTKIDEMYTVFHDGKVATRIAKWAFALMIALGGAVLLVKQIIK